MRPPLFAAAAFLAAALSSPARAAFTDRPVAPTVDEDVSVVESILADNPSICERADEPQRSRVTRCGWTPEGNAKVLHRIYQRKERAAARRRMTDKVYAFMSRAQGLPDYADDYRQSAELSGAQLQAARRRVRAVEQVLVAHGWARALRGGGVTYRYAEHYDWNIVVERD